MLNRAEQKQTFLKYDREMNEKSITIAAKVEELKPIELVNYYYAQMDKMLLSYNNDLDMSKEMWDTKTVYNEYNEAYNLKDGVTAAYGHDNAENKVRSIVNGEGRKLIKRAPLESAKLYEAEIEQPLRKEWQHGGSSDVRNNHVDADAQARRIGDDFDVSGKSVKAPGAFGDPAEDIHCSCYMVVIK